MRIQVEKFLAVTAMLASAAVMGIGCSSEDTDTNNGVSGGGGGGNKGGTGGKDGSSTGGTAGSSTGGTAGSSTGGVAGGGGTAGSTGDSGTCLGGDAAAEGAEIDCTTLPYYATVCVDPDAGTEGLPLGVQFCSYMAVNGRTEVNAELLTCLAAITGDACAAAHDTAVQSCYDTVAAQACQHAGFPDGDGGTYDPCKDIASSCSAISEAQCNLALNPLNSTYVVSVLNCYDTPTGAPCEDDFATCIGLP